MTITFKTFLLEYGNVGVTELSHDNVLSILREHCMQAVNGTPLYRGASQEFQYMEVDPSKRTRESRTTENLLLNLTVNLPSWKAFPPRNRSIFLTTTRDRTGVFGECFRAFPIDGASIALAPAPDFNYEKYIGKGIFNHPITTKQFQDTLRVVFERRSGHVRHEWIGGYEYEDVKKYCADCDNTFADMDLDKLKKTQDSFNNGPFGDLASGIADRFEDLAFKEKSFLKALQMILDPSRAGFALGHVSDVKKGSDVEVWTDSKCVLVHETYAAAMVRHLQNENN